MPETSHTAPPSHPDANTQANGGEIPTTIETIRHLDPTSIRTLYATLPLLERFVEPMDHYIHKSVQRIRRDLQSCILLQWAHEHHYKSLTAYEVRQTLISSSIPWMAKIAESLNGSVGSTLNIEDAKTAGYRTIVQLTYRFDPTEHGDSFQKFATPYVVAAIMHCHCVGSLNIEKQVGFSFLNELREKYDPSKRRDQTPSDTHQPHTVVRATTSDPPHASRAAPSDTKAIKPLPPQNSPSPPHPVSPKASQRVDEVAAKLQRKRYCEWAGEEYDVKVIGDAIDVVVTRLAEKLQPYAKEIANSIDIPTNFRGGKRAVRDEAQRALRGFVETYDPDGTVGFKQYLRNLLESHLNGFVTVDARKFWH